MDYSITLQMSSCVRQQFKSGLDQALKGYDSAIARSELCLCLMG